MIGLIRVAVMLTAIFAARTTCAAPREDLRAGMSAFDALEYDKATVLLQRALAHPQRLSREDTLLAWKTLAFAEVGLGRYEPAVQAFSQLLAFDPQAELDRAVSPRVRSAFDEARRQRGISTAPRPSAAPLAVALSPKGNPKKKPLYKKAWFWGVIAGSVVVATTAIVLGVTLSGTTGTITVVPE